MASDALTRATELLAGLATVTHEITKGLEAVLASKNSLDAVLEKPIPPGTTAEVRLTGRPNAVVGPGTHTFTAPAGGNDRQPQLARSAS